MTDWYKEIEKQILSKATIRKQGNMWCVFSKSGKNFGCYKTKMEAEKRLKQIETHKHINEDQK